MTVATMPSPQSKPLRLIETAEQRHQLIAIDHAAFFIDHDQAVGVTIERNANIGAGGQRPFPARSRHGSSRPCR